MTRLIDPVKILLGILYLILGLFVVASFSCRWGKYSSAPDIKIENINRIFMHQPNKYSIIYDKDSTGVSRLLKIDWIDSGSIKIVSDVAENKKMWARFKTEEAIYSKFGKQIKKDIHYLEMELHVHDVKNIEGGEWMEKRSRGSTVAIE